MEGDDAHTQRAALPILPTLPSPILLLPLTPTLDLPLTLYSILPLSFILILPLHFPLGPFPLLMPLFPGTVSLDTSLCLYVFLFHLLS